MALIDHRKLPENLRKIQKKEIVELIKSNVPTKIIATEIGIHQSMVSKYKRKYKDGGLNNVLYTNKRGR